MPIGQNTFKKGMNKDLDKSVRSADTYYHAENFRLMGFEDDGTLSLETVLGNELVISKLTSDEMICGYCKLRDDLILFVTDNDTPNPNGGVSKIYRARFVGEELELIGVGLEELELLYDDSTTTGFLKFSISHPIKAVARIETEEIEKVYWVDGNSSIRYMDINSTDLATQSVDKFEFLPNVYLQQPVLTDVVTGDIPVGKIQYAYQLYRVGGAETTFSPASQLIDVTTGNVFDGTDLDYRGSEVGQSSGKGCQITINYLNYYNEGFNRLRMIAIHYAYLSADPTVRIVEEKIISSDQSDTNDPITVVDTGSSEGIYTLEEYAILGTNLIKAKELEVKDDVLFAANITEDYFDVDFDARAYRFPVSSHDVQIWADNDYYLLRTAGVTLATYTFTEYDDSGTPTGTTYTGVEDIPEAYDCINLYNDIVTVDRLPVTPAAGNIAFNNVDPDTIVRIAGGFEDDGYFPGLRITVAGAGANNGTYTIASFATAVNPNDTIVLIATDTLATAGAAGGITITPVVEYCYQSNGTTLGGEGANIAYNFALKQIMLDQDNAGEVDEFNSEIDGSDTNPSYQNYASPFIASSNVGYQRDEVYRFGIVFFDDRGRSSFVKWIADIRMPRISQNNGANMYDTASWTPEVETITITGGATADGTIIFMVAGILEEYDVPVLNGDTVGGVCDKIFSVVQTQGSAYATITKTAATTITVTYDKQDPGANFGVLQLAPGVTGVGHGTATPQAYAAGGVGLTDHSIAFESTIGGTEVFGNILYPVFDIVTDGTDAEGYGYQIVRVKRESKDRSVVNAGIVTNVDDDGIGPDKEAEGFNIDIDAIGGEPLGCWNSPEVSFNQNLFRKSSDYIQMVGELANAANVGGAGFDYRVFTRKQIDDLGANEYVDEYTEVDSGMLLTQQTSTIAEHYIGGLTYFHYDSTTDHNWKATSFVFEKNHTTWFIEGKANKFYCYYRRDVHEDKYGGDTYNDRQKNFYIPASYLKKSVTGSIACFGGDTYVCMYDHTNFLFDLAFVAAAPGNSNIEVVYFPVESSINLALRYDESYHSVSGLLSSQLLQEGAGLHVDNAGLGANDYQQTTDLYLYNTVHSQENTSKTFIAEPTDWNQSVDYDCRITYSDTKFNGEIIDSWTKFRVANFLDVDTQFGAINNLELFNDSLMYWQDNAFGVLSVNTRSLVTDSSDVGALVVGTGGILDRFDYISTHYGNKYRFGLVMTDKSVFWIDSNRKEILEYQAKVQTTAYKGITQQLSTLKGIASYSKELGPLGLVHSVYDRENKEVLFTVAPVWVGYANSKTTSGNIDYGSEELTAAWTESAVPLDLDVFNSSAYTDIEDIDETTGNGGRCYSNEIGSVDNVSGDVFRFQCDLIVAGGGDPIYVYLSTDDGTDISSNIQTLNATQTYDVDLTTTGPGPYRIILNIENVDTTLHSLTNISCTQKFETAQYNIIMQGVGYPQETAFPYCWVNGQIFEYDKNGSTLELLPDYNTENYAMFDTTNKESIAVSFITEFITLVYNTVLQQFVGFYDIDPVLYIDYEDFFMSTEDFTNLYQHNRGDFLRWYGTHSNAELTVLFTQQYPLVKTFDNLLYVQKMESYLQETYPELRGDPVDIHSDTFTEVRFSNDYQNTARWDLVYGFPTDRTAAELEIKRRQRTWTCAIPRNATNFDPDENLDIFAGANLDTTQVFSDRMRDRYLKCELTYEPLVYTVNTIAFTEAGVGLSDYLTSSVAGFITAGFKAGDIITIEGASDGGNNGVNTIASVTPTTMTFILSDDLVNAVEGDTITIFKNQKMNISSIGINYRPSFRI